MPSHSLPRVSATPKTGRPNTGQMRTEWRYILKRSYLSLLSMFLFLFYNPETAVHQPPASAPQCPREQLRREVISQSDELQRGRQAGRLRGESKVVQIAKKGKETLLVAALPPIKGSVCLGCSHECSASLQGPPLLSQRPGVPTLLDTQSRNKTGPPPCHPVYMRDKITFVQK